MTVNEAVKPIEDIVHTQNKEEEKTEKKVKVKKTEKPKAESLDTSGLLKKKRNRG
jgi:hypothetical protein